MMTKNDTERNAALFNLSVEEFTTGQKVKDGRIVRHKQEPTATEIEQDIQRELMTCPACMNDVHTKPAEGVPAQSLRSCDECGHVFFMDLESTPRYE